MMSFFPQMPEFPEEYTSTCQWCLYCSERLSIFWWAFSDALAIVSYNQIASEARSHCISEGFVRSLVPFLLTSTMSWDEAASPEIVNYQASFSKAQRISREE